MEEFDTSTCRKCGEPKLRKSVGYFPDGRNKKFVDENGKQWVGRKCPGCVCLDAAVRIKEKRKNEKSGTDPKN